MTRFFVLMFVVAAAANTDSCRNEGSADKLNSRVVGYHKALEEGGVGSRYWSESFRRDAGEPEEVARKHKLQIKSVRTLGAPIVTKSYASDSRQALGRSTTYVEIVSTDGTTTRGRMTTTWAWLKDNVGFYDWYLVRIDDLIEVPDHEGPSTETQDKGRVEHSPHGLLIF
jgi:hypothetical protein